MKDIDELKKRVCEANKPLLASGLAALTWGNVSGLERKEGKMAIKPSGVDYEDLAADKIVVLSLASGEVCCGDLAPSSDTPTHLEIARAFTAAGAIVHTHSPYATAWAQAGMALPCLGTTHADTFFGDIPVCEQLTAEEAEKDYEANVGKAIVARFSDENLDPGRMPAVLVPGHGPFLWGETPEDAVKNAIVLEEVARMAHLTFSLRHECPRLPEYILKKHFNRKHGPDAYYGQKAT